MGNINKMSTICLATNLQTRNNCGKKVFKKAPRLSIDQVCDCEGESTSDLLCSIMPRGCRLTTKTPKKIPFPVEPTVTYEELSKKPFEDVKTFVESVKNKVQTVLLEKPKDTQVKLLIERLHNNEIESGAQCLQKPKKTRPLRIPSNREIMNRIMRRKILRERKCGERLGPYVQCDPNTLTSDLFAFCKTDRFKSCIQKKKQNDGSDTKHKREYVDLGIQTDETYIQEMKSAAVTKETMEEEEMKRLREKKRVKDEKKRLKKLKKNASVTVLDWNVKPNPCKALLEADGTCPEKDVNDSDVDSDDDKMECTCSPGFKYCIAMDFLRRKDYQHNWQPAYKCAPTTQVTKAKDNNS
ncbi:hypothetical protein HELRODRAFT_174729 [Helobdella robusta]|uniref:Uncharacterized protein n=1 Tax=Helobdella robusta TaxID=6412 RepID=T1F8E8_HELRO|nr:hypothetical protein HELRODRAFT_174729 [Helobdella robusta]ESO01745.1 hypothetical protein HELRODRAFT_174729 [Helobdella robusta]